MKVSFYLRKEKISKNGQAPIALIISGNGVIFRKNVKSVKCKLTDWDLKKERIKPSKKDEEYNFYIEFNKKIDDIENEIKELFRYLLLNNIALTKELIIQKLETNTSALKIAPEFFKVFDEFIEANKSTKAERTITGYTTTKNFLTDFQTNTRYKLQITDMNLDFFDKFSAYSFEGKCTGNNYFAKLTSILKTFLKWAEERGIHSNRDYLKFKATEEDIEVIHLTHEELMKLYNHQFKTKKLSQIRDVYCFGCFTGLRYSDVAALKAINIQEDYINLTIIKTRTINHNVPLLNYTKEILNKYLDTIYYPLPVVSSQKTNEYIKDCCEEVGIDTPITITRYIGSRRIDRTLPKYKLITFHTSRKTFITNSLMLGINERIVRSITGHKKESTFNKYVKLTEEYKKNELNNAWNNKK